MICPSPKALAIQVVNQRKKLGLSQVDVAERVGLKQKTISAFENNPESTKLSTVFLILSAVCFDLSVLDKKSRDSSWTQEW